MVGDAIGRAVTRARAGAACCCLLLLAARCCSLLAAVRGSGSESLLVNPVEVGPWWLSVKRRGGGGLVGLGWTRCSYCQWVSLPLTISVSVFSVFSLSVCLRLSSVSGRQGPYFGGLWACGSAAAAAGGSGNLSLGPLSVQPDAGCSI